jgi:hypothetical protein
MAAAAAGLGFGGPMVAVLNGDQLTTDGQVTAAASG